MEGDGGRETTSLNAPTHFIKVYKNVGQISKIEQVRVQTLLLPLRKLQ